MTRRKLLVKKGNYLEAYCNDGNIIGKFQNLDLLKVVLYQQGYKNPRDYTIIVTISFGSKDTKHIPLDEFQELGGKVWSTYSIEMGDFIQFEESYTELIQTLGYIIFDDGDIITSDREVAPKYSKKLMKNINSAIKQYMQESNYIYKCTIDENKHIKIYLRGSAQHIYICYNSQLMSMNQERKVNNVRCLPYYTNMDKYTTFYAYTSFQYYPGGEEDKEFAKYILNDILAYIGEYCKKEVKYKAVDFMGNIYL